MKFKNYTRTNIAEIREVTNEDFDSFHNSGDIVAKVGLDNIIVSISEQDRINGSPRVGDMIGRNPNNHKDQWLIARKYFIDNFKLSEDKVFDNVILTNDKGETINLNAVVPFMYYRVSEEGVDYINNRKISYNTRAFNVLDPDGIVRVYSIMRVKEEFKDKLEELKSFSIPRVEIEYPKDWWNSFTKREFFKEAETQYEMKYEGEYKFMRAGKDSFKEDIEGFELNEFLHLYNKALDLLKNNI